MASRSHFVRVSTLAAAAGALSLCAGVVQAQEAGFVECGPGVYCAAPTFTGGGSTSSGHRDTTQVFAGLNWTFGGGPELVVGVRALRTDASHKVAGARLEATFPFTPNRIAFDKLRLRLVGGHRSGMYELGGGYAFAGQGFILSSALQSDHVNVGTDFTLNGYQWQPFIGMNTLARAKAPELRQDGTPVCADGITPVRVEDVTSDVSVPPEAQRNGYTCVFAT